MTASSFPSPAPDAQTVRQWMSALADGQTEDPQAACKVWADDREARQAWHAYHLIGDVLRSDDLASSPARDEAFLSALRGRLAQEPAIVAPTPVAAAAATLVRPPAAASRPSRRWAVAAATAGVMMVGGVAVMLRDSGADATQLSSATAVPGGQSPIPVRAAIGGATAPQNFAMPSASGAGFGEPQWQVLDGRIVREAQLDAYLRAHRGTLAPRPGVVGGRYETVGLER